MLDGALEKIGSACELGQYSTYELISAALFSFRHFLV
jgi:hypothetical protein